MKRTVAQNASLHKWLNDLAIELNASGQSLGDGILVRLPVSYTGDNLKESVLRPYMGALYPDITSTTQLDTKQIQQLYDDLNIIIAERSGVSLPFPSVEEQINQSRIK